MKNKELYIAFFQFLEKKRGKKLPVRYKLILGLSLSKDELKVSGFLDLYNTQITSLPSGLEVGGFLDLYNSQITSLPEDLKVGGSLSLSKTQITSLPSGLEVGGDIFVDRDKVDYFKNTFIQFSKKIKGW